MRASLVPMAAAVIAVAVGSMGARSAPAAPTLVIEADRILTIAAEQPIVNGVVVVAGNRITFVGRRAQMPDVAGAQVLRPANATVLPGLWDSHVHFRTWMPRLFLFFGVTTILDTGNKDVALILNQREQARTGKLTGPRMFVVGRALTGPPPPGAARAPGQDEGAHTVVGSGDQARATARALLDRGVDAIKVHEWLPAPLIRVVVDEARRANKPVVGHLGIRADYAVEAGLTGLIHPYGIAMATTSDPRVREEIERRMPDYQARREYYPYHELSPAGYQRLITLMLGRHVFFNPTFGAQFRGVYPQGQAFDEYARTFLGDHRVEFPELAPVWTDLLPFHTRLRSHSIDEPQRRVLVDGMEKLARFMREFSAAGGKMIAGTDVSRSGVPGLHVHRELELWVQNGVRPIEALRAATMYPAELLRQERDLGTIAVGKLADLLVVEGNPLDDVRATRNILHVIKEGRVLARPVPVGPVALAASAAWRESRQR